MQEVFQDFSIFFRILFPLLNPLRFDEDSRRTNDAVLGVQRVQSNAEDSQKSEGYFKYNEKDHRPNDDDLVQPVGESNPCFRRERAAS